MLNRHLIAYLPVYAAQAVVGFGAVIVFTRILPPEAYGRYTLLPLFGPELYSTLTIWGKYAHNFLAFPFMLAVVMMFVLWVRHNIPDKTDWNWLKVGGGLFSKGVHPKAKKFNAGQKVIFWSVVLGGVLLSVSGIVLLFPLWFTGLWAVQLAQISHAVIGVVLMLLQAFAELAKDILFLRTGHPPRHQNEEQGDAL